MNENRSTILILNIIFFSNSTWKLPHYSKKKKKVAAVILCMKINKNASKLFSSLYYKNVFQYI